MFFISSLFLTYGSLGVLQKYYFLCNIIAYWNLRLVLNCLCCYFSGRWCALHDPNGALKILVSLFSFTFVLTKYGLLIANRCTSFHSYPSLFQGYICYICFSTGSVTGTWMLQKRIISSLPEVACHSSTRLRSTWFTAIKLLASRLPSVDHSVRNARCCYCEWNKLMMVLTKNLLRLPRLITLNIR